MASGLEGARKRSILSRVGSGEVACGEGETGWERIRFYMREIGPGWPKQTCDRSMGFRTKPLAHIQMPPYSTLDSTMSLFVPDDPWNTSRLFRFLREVNDRHGLELESYEDLYQWSISHTDLFWSHVWDHTQIIGDKGGTVVDTKAKPAENPSWFSDSSFNFAENLLSNRSPHTTAIIQVCTLQFDACLGVLGNELCMQRNQLPRIPSPNLSRFPTHSSTRSSRTRFPVSSSTGSYRVIALRHTRPTG